MKKFIAGSMLLLLPLYFFAQADTTSKAMDYMKKSKRQRTAANIMLYGGIATVLTSLAVAAKETDDSWFSLLGRDETSNFGGANVLIITGATSMVASIPLFIAAGKNRRKASATISFDMKKTYRLEPLAMSSGRLNVKRLSYPALILKIPL